MVARAIHKAWMPHVGRSRPMRIGKCRFIEYLNEGTMSTVTSVNSTMSCVERY